MQESVLQRGSPSGVSRTITLIGLGLGLGMFYTITQSLELSIPEVLNAPPAKVELASSVIVEEIRSSAKLLTTTVPGHAEVSAGVLSDSIITNAFYKDYLRLMSYGEVFAGFDLKNLTEADIQQTESEVVVHLGSSEIITTRLDNKATHMLTKELGFFKRIFGEPDIQLEGKARLEAEIRITASVCGRALANAVEKGVQEFQPSLQAFFRVQGDQRRVRIVAEKGRCA